MSKKQERQKKLAELHDWCWTLSSLILEGSMSANDEALRLGIDSALSRGDLRGLETVARDLHEWASGLSPIMRARIDRELRVKFGRGLTEEAEDLARAARAILKRGRIVTDDECRFLEALADQITGDSARTHELAAIRALLKSYLETR